MGIGNSTLRRPTGEAWESGASLEDRELERRQAVVRAVATTVLGAVVLEAIVSAPGGWRDVAVASVAAIACVAFAVYTAAIDRRRRDIARSLGAESERARLARELHDGLVQSLIGADMQLEVISRRARAGDRPAPIANELTSVQQIIRQETLTVRELMARLKPLDLEPYELPQYVSEMVNRFAYDTGIQAEASVDGAPFAARGRECVEIVRVLQEALSNVRKHSSATKVTVSINWTAEPLVLSVEDNGCGFPFDGCITCSVGRLDLADCHLPDQPQLRPLVPGAIAESVRGMAGELVVRSRQGAGARLDITVPRQQRASRPASDRIAS
jgi:signal transduction histidine kinase